MRHRALWPGMLLALLITWLPVGLATAQDVVSDELGRAAQAFGEDRADEAVRIYEQILTERGPQADVYYNLGLAQAAAGDLALATLSLERSLALDPGADDAEAELERVRGALHESLLAESTERGLTRGESQAFVWWRFFGSVSQPLVATVLLAFWLLLFGLLVARRLWLRHQALRDASLVVIVLSALVALTAAGYLVGHHLTDDLRPAVVVSAQPLLYESPIELATTSRPDDLYRGALVRVVEDRGEWLRVELMDGTTGWLERDAIGEVRVDRWSASLRDP